MELTRLAWIVAFGKHIPYVFHQHMGGSKNNGTPKSSILKGFPL